MADNAPVSQAEELPSAARLRDIIETVIAEARALGASDVEAAVSADAGLSVNVRNDEVETVEHHRDKGLGVTVYFGQRKGNASTTDFNPAALSDTVMAACDIARYISEDPYAGLADADCLARDIPDLDLYHPWTPSTAEAIALALECERAARGADQRIVNSEGAYISTHAGLRVYGNSRGFLGDYASSRHSLGCTVIARGEGGMQRDHWYSISRRATDLESASSIGQQAAARTVQRLDGRKLSTRKAPVIFSAEVARGLLGHLVRAVSGGSLYRRSSFLLDSLGKPLFPEFVEINERPHLPRALGSAPFDSEGVATRERTLVSGGVLQSYILDSYAARRLGLQTTGNAGGVHNLEISAGDMDLAGMLKAVGTGLLVTEVMGQGVNIVTGDYSRGASGFWVENGEIQYPVEEITLAGHLAEMFRGLQAVASDVDRRGNLCSGSWWVEGLTIAGN
ncbi:MAG: metalloprotease PmbA [Gammaproteobacteria bacterium]